MKPILFSADDTEFTSNGLGRLADCVSCVVTEERNGIYECEFKYPVTGPMYSAIHEGGVIGVIHDDHHDVQPFDIYARSAPIDGLVTFYAHHISYRLRNVILKPFTATSCADALAQFETQTYNPNPFTFWTDKAVNGRYVNDVPAAVRGRLAGQAGSILDVYGKGEYQYDKWAVRLYTNRGADNGVAIRYGVNLTDITQEVDQSEIYSAVAPYWKDEESGRVVTLPEGYVVSENVPVQLYPWTTDTGDVMTNEDGEILEFAVPQIIPVPLDLSDRFDEQPTVEQLRQAAKNHLASSTAYLPSENLTVSFVDLAHTEEYAGVAALQRVSLCDRVSVYCGPIGVEAASMQVIRVVYNVLAERYDEIELGSPRRSYADTIMAEVEDITSRYIDQDALERAVDSATDQITGAKDSHVRFMYDADGGLQEILIMDTDDIATAQNVWRWNSGGFGHSSNGYGGPYTTAITQDGAIVADFITTGELTATLIKAGVLRPKNGNQSNFWNMDTGEFSLKSNGATDGITYIDGVLHINASNIDVGELTASLIKAGILQDKAGLNSWNLATGEFSTTGSFSATTTRSGHTYRITIETGNMYFYYDGTLIGSLYPDANTLNIRGSSNGMNINLWTSQSGGTGSALSLGANGQVALDCLGFRINGDLSIYNYEGWSGYIPTQNGEIHVENGLIVGYTPDT